MCGCVYVCLCKEGVLYARPSAREEREKEEGGGVQRDCDAPGFWGPGGGGFVGCLVGGPGAHLFFGA